MAQIPSIFRLLADPRGERENRSSPSPRQQRRQLAPTAPQQPMVFGPGAVIGGGTPARLTPDEQKSTQRFATHAVRAARGSTRQPVIPGATRAASPFPVGPGGVVESDPLADAARATSVPQDYLNALVGHESGGVSDARAATSTATGHAQFIDSTWLDMVRRYGARYGAADLAESIGSNNKVSDRARRTEILDLRNNPRWAAIMAAHYAQDNASALRARLGRNVRESEVYIAHFAGDAKAADLIRAAESETQGNARTGVSIVGREAAEANGRVFYVGGNYDRDGRYLGGGRPATAREVVTRQSRNFRNAMWPGQPAAPRPQAGLRPGMGLVAARDARTQRSTRP